MNATTAGERFSWLASVRSIVPRRPLTYFEARAIAELQASRVRSLAGVSSPELPEDVIPDLPRVEVREVTDLPSSGCSGWDNGRWVIAINGLEPWQRQRFSQGHELWHVINWTTLDYLLPGAEPLSPQAERLADYFSGCLYMPRRHLRAAVAQGCDLDDLADLFGVSTAAASVRLSQLHLYLKTPSQRTVAA